MYEYKTASFRHSFCNKSVVLALRRNKSLYSDLADNRDTDESW